MSRKKAAVGLSKVSKIFNDEIQQPVKYYGYNNLNVEKRKQWYRPSISMPVMLRKKSCQRNESNHQYRRESINGR
jgi:hypothetical protein